MNNRFYCKRSKTINSREQFKKTLKISKDTKKGYPKNVINTPNEVNLKEGNGLSPDKTTQENESRPSPSSSRRDGMMIWNHEPISRSVQLHRVRGTAFSETDLF